MMPRANMGQLFANFSGPHGPGPVEPEPGGSHRLNFFFYSYEHN